MAQRGGKRAGAGRKPGSVNESKLILQKAIDSVARKRGGYESLIGHLWELAEGVEVQKETKRDGEVIYSQPPDAFAAKILLEFRFGKAPQPLTDENGEKLEGLDVLIIRKQ